MSKRLITLPAVKSIVLGSYTLTATHLEIRGRPSFEEHEQVGTFIRHVHKQSGWWFARWLAYGESRQDWIEKLDQIENDGSYARKTLINLKYLATHVDASHQRDDVEFSLHFEVAPLSAKEQDDWLEQAATHGWTRVELRRHIRAAQRTKIIDGQAVLEGMYRVIYADCPWTYTDSGPTIDGSLGKAARHFPSLTIAELCDLPVKAHALKDAILFFWVTATMLYENPGPRDVIEAWGFTPKTGRVWDKVLGMPGHYASQVTHEHLIIATRGSALPDVPTPHADSVFVERRGLEHSGKPESVRAWIMAHWTRGPYLELFGRQRVEGWDVFGNDARLWAQDAARSA